MVQGGQEIISTNIGNIVKVRKPAVVKFKRFAAPMKTSLLPKVRGTAEARGYLRTEDAAKEFSRHGLGFFEGENGDKKDVTENRIIEFLFQHPMYLREFVAVGRDGAELREDDRFFVPEGDEGGYFCTACNKHLKSVQAKEGHKTTSKAHAEAVKKAASISRTNLLEMSV